MTIVIADLRKSSYCCRIDTSFISLRILRPDEVYVLARSTFCEGSLPDGVYAPVEYHT